MTGKFEEYGPGGAAPGSKPVGAYCSGPDQSNFLMAGGGSGVGYRVPGPINVERRGSRGGYAVFGKPEAGEFGAKSNPLDSVSTESLIAELQRRGALKIEDEKPEHIITKDGRAGILWREW